MAPQQTRDTYLGLVLAGWVMAFYLPLGGLVAAFLLADRRPGHAAGIIAVSCLWIVAAVLVVLLFLDPLD